MRRSAGRLLCAAAFLAGGFAVAAHADPVVDGRRAPAKGWPMVAGDWGGGRYSQLTQIDTTNIKQLGGAWMHGFGDEHSRGTPVVVDGMMFVTADAVSMAGMVRDTGLEKVRQAYNEFASLPTRIKVAAGAKVTWTNNGKVTHNATAQDGSWSTGDVPPGGTASVTFAKPGSFTYIDKNHPFAFGQVNVQ